MRISNPVLVLAFASLLTSCVTEKPTIDKARLLGSWQTQVVPTEWGPSVLEVTFYSDSELEFKLTQVSTQETLVSKGSYQLRGNKLVSEAINKGSAVSVLLEQDHLIIHTPSEKPHKFNRKP